MGYTRSADFTGTANLRASTLRTELARLRSFLNGGLAAADLQAVTIFDLPALAQPYSIAHLPFASEGPALSDVASAQSTEITPCRISLPVNNATVQRLLLLAADVTYRVTIGGAGVTAADFSLLEVDIRADAEGATNSTRLSTPINVLAGRNGVAPFATGALSPETTVRLSDRTSPQLVVGEITSRSVTDLSFIEVVVRARKVATVSATRTVTMTQLHGTLTVGFLHAV